MGGLDTGWRLAALGLGWIAGVALQLRQGALWPQMHYGLLAGLGALGLALAWRWRPAFGAAALGVLLLGFGATGWQAAQRMAAVLPAHLEGRDIVVTGVVASLPQPGPNGVRFRLEVEEARLSGQPVELPPRLALGWYAGFREDPERAERRLELRAGQRWRFTVRLRQPHGNLNPHGFDYELFLLEQGVRATGSVREAELLDAAAGYPVERLRQRVRDAIEAHVADRRAAGVLAALAVGDQGAIDGLG
jgi:competence protein ComEC